MLTSTHSEQEHPKVWGLLRPLFVPDRPWKMIAMDFIVELPPSEDYSAIFVVEDRLSKMAHSLPLKGTLSAAETARVFIKEVVRLHGIPMNIDFGRHYVGL